MQDLFNELGLKRLTDKEYTYLKEYLTIMKPISSYLDVLHAESNCYFGFVLPIIVKVWLIRFLKYGSLFMNIFLINKPTVKE